MQKDIKADSSDLYTPVQRIGREYLPRERIKSFEDPCDDKSPLSGQHTGSKYKFDVFSNPSAKNINQMDCESHPYEEKAETKSTSDSIGQINKNKLSSRRVLNMANMRRKSKVGTYVYTGEKLQKV